MLGGGGGSRVCLGCHVSEGGDGRGDHGGAGGFTGGYTTAAVFNLKRAFAAEPLGAAEAWLQRASLEHYFSLSCCPRTCALPLTRVWKGPPAPNGRGDQNRKVENPTYLSENDVASKIRSACGRGNYFSWKLFFGKFLRWHSRVVHTCPDCTSPLALQL